MVEENLKQTVRKEGNSVGQKLTPETINTPPLQGEKKSKILLGIILFIFLLLIGIGGFWYYSKGQALLLSKNMKWVWGHELKSYKINSQVNFFLKDFFSEQPIPFFSLEQGLELESELNSKVIENNIEGEFKVNISGIFASYFEIIVKKIGSDFYLKPNITILSEPIPELILAEDEWISISEKGLEIPFINIDPKEYSQEMNKLNEKFRILLNRLREEKILIIKDLHQSIASRDGKLKEIQYSIEEDRVEDFLFILMEVITEKSREELEKEDQREKYEEIMDNIGEVIKKAKFSLFINTKTKFIQGISFALIDFDLKTENISALINFSTNNILEIIEPSEITKPNNIVTFTEVFLERPLVKEAEEFSQSLITPLLDCFDGRKEINYPKVGEKICAESMDYWGIILPEGYTWANYSRFDIVKRHSFDIGNYYWEYCLHHEKLDDLQCTGYPGRENGCQKVEECQIVLDFDQDGLTEEEELNIYNADPYNPDTDGDGYEDGAEVDAGYNPLGEGLLEIDNSFSLNNSWWSSQKEKCQNTNGLWQIIIQEEGVEEICLSLNTFSECSTNSMNENQCSPMLISDEMSCIPKLGSCDCQELSWSQNNGCF